MRQALIPCQVCDSEVLGCHVTLKEYRIVQKPADNWSLCCYLTLINTRLQVGDHDPGY